jgi:hypothetical protein
MTDKANKVAVLAVVANNPRASTQQTSHGSGISHTITSITYHFKSCVEVTATIVWNFVSSQFISCRIIIFSFSLTV